MPRNLARTQLRARVLAEAPDWTWRSKHPRSRPLQAIEFIQTFCTVPSGHRQGRPYQLLAFQKQLLREALDAPESVQTIVWQLARGAGKTGLLAGLLAFLLYERDQVEVVTASTGMRTSRLAYDRVVKMIEQNETLHAQAFISRATSDPYIELPRRGSKLTPLPAEERYLIGLAVDAIVIDELGYVDAATWEVLQSSLGKVRGSKLYAAGTPGIGITTTSGEDNRMYWLRERQAGPDPLDTVRYREYSAAPDADPSRPSTWKQANPGLGTLVTKEAVHNDYLTLPSYRFAQLRLSQWGTGAQTWIDLELWESIAHAPGLPPAGDPVTLGFDGSSSTDATALVLFHPATEKLHLLGHWSPPERVNRGPGRWQVPRHEVEDVLADAFGRWDVRKMLYDPWLWRSEAEEWQERWGSDVVEALETNQATKMGPATDRFYTALRKGELATDGSDTLRSHALSATVITKPAGDVLAKDARHPRHIDALIAAVLAHYAAAEDEGPPTIF